MSTLLRDLRTPPKRVRRVPRWAAPIGAVILITIGAAITIATPGAPSIIDVHGTLTIATPSDWATPDGRPGYGHSVDGQPCTGSGPYSDVHTDTAVTITDQSINVLASPTLGQGAVVDVGSLAAAGCRFGFTVQVPDGRELYIVAVTGYDRAELTRDQIASGVSIDLDTVR